MTLGLEKRGREHHRSLGEVSVWSANLDDLPCLPGLLSHDEVARSERFSTSQLRNRYIAGRGWVRSVLGSEVGLHPAAVRFRYLELGKPVVEHPPNILAFSLAHSADEALLAVGPPGGLGIDVERVTAGAYDPASADLVLSFDELRWIEHQADRDRAFLRCWVRKEAYAKVGGLGMDRHLAGHTFTGPHAHEEHEGLTIRDMFVESGLVAASAVPLARTVRYRGRWFGREAA